MLHYPEHLFMTSLHPDMLHYPKRMRDEQQACADQLQA